MAALEAVLDHDERPRGDRVLTVGDMIPDFRLPALAATVGHGWEFDSAWLRGRWVALLYWPKQSCLESLGDYATLVSRGLMDEIRRLAEFHTLQSRIDVAE